MWRAWLLFKLAVCQRVNLVNGILCFSILPVLLAVLLNLAHLHETTTRIKTGFVPDLWIVLQQEQKSPARLAAVLQGKARHLVLGGYRQFNGAAFKLDSGQTPANLIAVLGLDFQGSRQVLLHQDGELLQARVCNYAGGKILDVESTADLKAGDCDIATEWGHIKTRAFPKQGQTRLYVKDELDNLTIFQEFIKNFIARFIPRHQAGIQWDSFAEEGESEATSTFEKHHRRFVDAYSGLLFAADSNRSNALASTALFSSISKYQVACDTQLQLGSHHIPLRMLDAFEYAPRAVLPPHAVLLGFDSFQKQFGGNYNTALLYGAKGISPLELECQLATAGMSAKIYQKSQLLPSLHRQTKLITTGIAFLGGLLWLTVLCNLLTRMGQFYASPAQGTALLAAYGLHGNRFSAVMVVAMAAGLGLYALFPPFAVHTVNDFLHHYGFPSFRPSAHTIWLAAAATAGLMICIYGLEWIYRWNMRRLKRAPQQFSRQIGTPENDSAPVKPSQKTNRQKGSHP